MWRTEGLAGPPQKAPALDETFNLEPAKTGRLPKSYLSILGVSVGSDSLDSVEKRLGPGKRFRVGQDPVVLRDVCYTVTAPNGPAVVAFESDAMGGWVDVTSAAVGTAESFGPYEAACRGSQITVGEGVSAGGLALGITRAEVKKLLSTVEPMIETKTRIGYLFKDKGLLSGVMIGMVDDRAVWFRVYASEVDSSEEAGLRIVQ
jgi:hypothetical protein